MTGFLGGRVVDPNLSNIFEHKPSTQWSQFLCRLRRQDGPWKEWCGKLSNFPENGCLEHDSFRFKIHPFQGTFVHFKLKSRGGGKKSSTFQKRWRTAPSYNVTIRASHPPKITKHSKHFLTSNYVSIMSQGWINYPHCHLALSCLVNW